ncbi:alpha mannosidase-like protein [Linnemannia schmuckeri]|uniref:alpha-1,2-Mannosidase n=1 Tax=Linnemannia schmuckeri TaxID=64567 RepID=A0A9P5S682_9FUNG|nr:alpha mannosidase-like protein [Linnemannia schmuckeri]
MDSAAETGWLRPAADDLAKEGTMDNSQASDFSSSLLASSMAATDGMDDQDCGTLETYDNTRNSFTSNNPTGNIERLSVDAEDSPRRSLRPLSSSSTSSTTQQQSFTPSTSTGTPSQRPFPTGTNNANNANGNGNGNGGIRPWILILVFSVFQLLMTSPSPSNGVNASSHSAGSNVAAGSNNGGSGNSAQGGQRGGGGAGVYNQQYFRQLPPIIDPSQGPGKVVTERMTEIRRLELREDAKEMFMHGYHGYLNFAFPKDELNPVACIGRGPDKRNPKNIHVNDVLGDFSLTLIDALDTLAAMREPEKFRQAIELVKRHVGNFNIDSRVQVFEVNIRVLGALLSGHLYASDPAFKSQVKGYKGELLVMAEDLGKRLMKAFENTPTGIPYARVNLRKGVLRGETGETCVAGAGSLLLEFGVLSRLTGNDSYEAAAKRALLELWKRRSKIGLMGNTIDMTTGNWMSMMTGIGAGTDSYYEYLLKSYVLFGDDEYLDMYETAQESIRRNLLHDSKYFYKHVHLEDGSLMATWVDSLSAFMPGVQVVGGDLESAIKNHLYYYNIWRKYQAIPERFNFVSQSVDISNYPLRPEFVESNYFLYRATKDPFYLQVGEMILRDLQALTKTKCGWASLKSVVDRKLEDRMESFALSETFKYLYLLFDEENILHQELKDSNFVFTTEGHVLALANKYLDFSRKNSTASANAEGEHIQNIGHDDDWSAVRHEYPRHQQQVMDNHHHHHQHNSRHHRTQRGKKVRQWPMCQAYKAPETFLKSIPYRPDADFARQMVGNREDPRDLLELDPKGYCEKPTLEMERVVVEFTGPPRKTVYHGDSSTASESSESASASSSSSTSSTGTHRAGGGESAEAQKLKELMVIPVKKGVFVNRIVGVKMQLQYDEIYNGYRAVKVGSHPLSLNCNVYVDHSSMQPLWDSYQRAQDAHLRIQRTTTTTTSTTTTTTSESKTDSVSTAKVEKDFLVTPADFGYWRPSVVDYHTDSTVPRTTYETILVDPDLTATTQQSQPQQQSMTTTGLVRIKENEKGCRPFTTAQSAQIRNNILVVDRGGCLFILKAFYAQAAGAQGIVVINWDDTSFAMTGPSPEEAAATTATPTTTDTGSATEGKKEAPQLGEGIPEDAIDIHSVMIGLSEGQVLLDWIHEATAAETQSKEADADASDSSSSSSSSNASGPRPGTEGATTTTVRSSGLVASFVQRKLTKEQLANARLSYNSLPIVNIHSISVPMATFG